LETTRATRQYFRRKRGGRAKANHDVEALSEDELKQILEHWLQSTGWETQIAWGKTQGIDIDAKRGDERWIIEVKGPGSRQPMRVNYFIGILGETLQRMADPKAEYSIALPDLAWLSTGGYGGACRRWRKIERRFRCSSFQLAVILST